LHLLRPKPGIFAIAVISFESRAVAGYVLSMPILVACQCGKKFKAADQFAGKTVRCPGCGNPLAIPKAAPAATAPSRPKPSPASTPLPMVEDEIFQPSSAVPAEAAPKRPAVRTGAAAVPPLSKSKRDTSNKPVPSITVSPKIIVLVVLVILIPSAIYWAKEGPMKAEAEWNEISAKAEDNLVGQITHAIEDHYKSEGVDTLDVKYPHKATSAFFDQQVMMLSLPESVPFQGNSTEGHFTGVFHPRTWRFEAEVPIEGNTHKVEGSAGETDLSLSVDGKTAQK
jgi:hypothetical protein